MGTRRKLSRSRRRPEHRARRRLLDLARARGCANVHFGQTGWFDGRPNSLDFREEFPYEQTMARQKSELERYYRAYLCSGVTAVFDTGGYPWSLDLRAATEHNPKAPHVAAAGPRITHAPPAALNLPAEQQYLLFSDEEAGRDAVRFMAAFGADAIKVWFLRVREEEEEAIDSRVTAVGEEAAARGLPLIVHATSLREAKVALNATSPSTGPRRGRPAGGRGISLFSQGKGNDLQRRRFW